MGEIWTILTVHGVDRRTEHVAWVDVLLGVHGGGARLLHGLLGAAWGARTLRALGTAVLFRQYAHSKPSSKHLVTNCRITSNLAVQLFKYYNMTTQ